MSAINLILKRYLQAIEIAEGLPEDCWRRYLINGHYYNEMNQKKDALKNYLKAHGLNPKHRNPLFNLIFFHKFENEYKKVFEYAFKMLEINMNDIDALAMLIDPYFDTQQFEKVIELSKNILAIPGERENIYVSLAFSYLMQVIQF